MKIQIDIPEKVNKKLNIEKAELEFTKKSDLIIYILANYYGVKIKAVKK